MPRDVIILCASQTVFAIDSHRIISYCFIIYRFDGFAWCLCLVNCVGSMISISVIIHALTLRTFYWDCLPFEYSQYVRLAHNSIRFAHNKFIQSKMQTEMLSSIHINYAFFLGNSVHVTTMWEWVQSAKHAI